MFKNLLWTVALFGAATLSAQLNTTLLGNLDYNDGVNDVWGYVAPDGQEIAVVGLETGTSFVSLPDGDGELEEIARFAGDFSPWRDMKSWREYVYVVADRGFQGLTVYDMSDLDTIIEQSNIYDISNNQFLTAHNIYVDTATARAFVSGGSYRGILIFDLDVADPMRPELIVEGPSNYSHDVYVQGNRMYTSDIFSGDLKIYDISDINDIQLVSSTPTPFTFTHNAWTTDDRQFVFTTDEQADAPVAAYDISDEMDVRETFQFRPLASVNTGTIPHNVHVIDEYLSISYYTDGLVVADASEPDNIIEVANYDTWPGANGDFNGAWGAYPFLPSGRTLISDRQTGLYVVGVDYKRAARLEGIVTDSITGLPINAATVVIDAEQVNGVMTDATGLYKTGLADAGTYTVTINGGVRYFPKTLTVDLANDVIEQLDVELRPKRTFNITANVVADTDDSAIDGATLVLLTEGDRFDGESADGGVFNLNEVPENDYILAVVEWGYVTYVEENVDLETLSGRTFRLERGYTDDFLTDEGWTIVNQPVNGNFTGAWERGVPQPTFDGDLFFQPGIDVQGDLGDQAYITGNTSGSAGENDVDQGATLLISPVFDATIVADPAVTFQTWFATAGGNGNPIDDALTITLDNGTEQVEVTVRDEDFREWVADTIVIADFMTATENMTLIARISDQVPNSNEGHLTEGGFDNFSLINNLRVATEADFGNLVDITVSPNPAADRFRLAFDLNETYDAELRVTDVTGRVLETQDLGRRRAGAVYFGEALRPGVYFLEIISANQRVYTTKVVKQ